MMTTPFNSEEEIARRKAERDRHKRELVVAANPERRAREPAEKYGLDADEVLMRLRERFLAVVEDVEAAMQSKHLTDLGDVGRTELREWLKINEDARAIAAKWGLDSVRVLPILLKTAGVGYFSCGRGEVKYYPCLETALTRAKELGLFSPLEVVQYFVDYLLCIVEPDESEIGLLANVGAVMAVISLLAGKPDGPLAPLLSRLQADPSAKAKSVEPIA